MRKKKSVKSALSLLRQDFHYGAIEYDYDTIRHCTEDSCGNVGDYCRCSTIENACVTSVDIDYIIDNNTSEDEITKYCLNRILTVNNIYESDRWFVSTCRGYYGEEISSVNLICEYAKDAEQQIANLLAMTSNSEKIEFVLELEYGYVLEAIKGMEWAVEELKKDQLTLNEDYHSHIKVNGSGYPYTPKIHGVVTERDGKYRLIDGFHRYATLGKKDSAKFIVGRM